MKNILIILGLFGIFQSLQPIENLRPIIGILTLPSELNQYPPEEYSSLDASYVKYIEGAMVIPIQWDWTIEELQDTLSKINGVLLTGGGNQIYLEDVSPGYNYNKLTLTVVSIFNKAIQINNQGKVFPILGICQGFELLNYIASNFDKILSAVQDDIQQSRLITITRNNSYMFESLLPNVKTYIQSQNGHSSTIIGLPFLKHIRSTKLYRNSLISRVYVRMGRVQHIFVLVSSSGGFYIFILITYQKHQYEFATRSEHTLELVQMGQHFANQFILKARQNLNTMRDEEQFQKIIYNYDSIMTMQDQSMSQSQTYIFNRSRQVL